ncbi:unnamed protein product, partial [Phaeothamnion confervicola]
SRDSLKRVRSDLRAVMSDPLPGIFVCPDESNVTVIYALVTGPFDTPYEGGFFLFLLQFADYPQQPPKVKLLTTGGGTVRFNPNLYNNGKVCLSILGTWAGPGWTPVHTISSVLLSIQSIMNAQPYHNEPGHETAWNPRDVQAYNDCIQHEMLRVAVCEMVGDTSMWRSLPGPFQTLVRDLFLTFQDHYEMVCAQNAHMDGSPLVDPFGTNKGTFQ